MRVWVCSALLLVLAGLMIVGPTSTATAQTGVSEFMEIYTAAKGILHVGVDIAAYIGKWFNGNCWHDWAMCEYESGFRLYNRFKRKRFRNGAKEVIDYFRDGGDGDSFYGAVDGWERHVNLRRDRAYIEKVHGPIKRIVAIERPPSRKHEGRVSFISYDDPDIIVTLSRN